MKKSVIEKHVTRIRMMQELIKQISNTRNVEDLRREFYAAYLKSVDVKYEEVTIKGCGANLIREDAKNGCYYIGLRCGYGMWNYGPALKVYFNQERGENYAVPAKGAAAANINY